MLNTFGLTFMRRIVHSHALQVPKVRAQTPLARPEMGDI